MIAQTSEFQFSVEPGMESLTLPHGWARPDNVWLLDIRRRRMYLEKVSVDDFAVLGRRYRLSSDEAPTHLRGLPRYYCVRDKVMWFWPVPAHAWAGAMSKDQTSEQE